MTMSCFGPLFRREGSKGCNRPNSVPLKQNDTKSPKADDYFKVAGNSALTMALRDKIATFRDIMDLPACNASSPMNQLVMGLTLDLQKLYPEIVHYSQLSEMKGASTEKILASFCNAMKSIGDLWITNHDRLDKQKYDIPSFKENVNWEQRAGTVLATLECLIKMARDKFDMMDEEEQKGNSSPQGDSFQRFIGDTDSDTYTSSCPSPITPSSVLPDVIEFGSPKSQRRSNTSSNSLLLLTLRVQAVGKLNPIDVKHLSLHLSNKEACDKSNKLVDEPSRETVESSPKKISGEEKRCSSAGDITAEVPNPSLNENDTRNGIIDSNNCNDISIQAAAPETFAVDTKELPLSSPRTSSPNLTATATATATPTPPSLPTVSSHVRSSPPPKTLESTKAAPSPPPANAAEARQPPLCMALGSTEAASPAPPPAFTVLNEAPARQPLPTPSKTLLSTKVSPPPPPPTLSPLNAAPSRQPPTLGSTKAAAPPPPPLPMAPGSAAAGPQNPPPFPVATKSAPPPMRLANGAAPPPPPPMLRPANGTGPPPPPALGGRSLLAKKSDTKLKRSSQMGSLYRTLKGKVEGSSLDGKSSNGRKGAAGSSTTGGKGMADALAEMTKRSGYFQQIEEEVQKYSKAIINLRSTLSSFQTKDMNELVEFHKQLESILEHFTDESQVLSRFEGFPTKKLETLRTAAALHLKLNSMISELHNWKIEAPLGPLLDKTERYFTKLKGEIDKLERTKDEEAKKFQSQNIYFDFNILIRVKEAMVDVSSGCMELALKERREAKANGESQTTETKTDKKQLKGSVKMLWRAFQFAFKVYTFAGGHDDRADMLTRELATEIESDPHHH